MFFHEYCQSVIFCDASVVDCDYVCRCGFYSTPSVKGLCGHPEVDLSP